MSDFKHLQRSVTTAGGELRAKRVVQKALSAVGHRGNPKRKAEKDCSSWVWKDTPFGDIVLVRKPGCAPELHRLAAASVVKTRMRNTPAPTPPSALPAPAPPRMKRRPPTVPTAQRHPSRRVETPSTPPRALRLQARMNPAKGPVWNDIWPSSTYPQDGAATYFRTLEEEVQALPVSSAIEAAIVRFWVNKALKTVPGASTSVSGLKVVKGGGGLDVEIRTISGAPFSQADRGFLHANILGYDPGGNTSDVGLKMIAYDTSGPGYSAGTPGGFLVPGKHVKYVRALIASAVKANGGTLSAVGKAAIQKPKVTGTASLQTGGYTATITWKGNTGLYAEWPWISDKTLREQVKVDAKAAVAAVPAVLAKNKTNTFLGWSGQEGKYGFPPKVWYVGFSDQSSWTKVQPVAEALYESLLNSGAFGDVKAIGWTPADTGLVEAHPTLTAAQVIKALETSSTLHGFSVVPLHALTSLLITVGGVELVVAMQDSGVWTGYYSGHSQSQPFDLSALGGSVDMAGTVKQAVHDISTGLGFILTQLKAWNSAQPVSAQPLGIKVGDFLGAAAPPPGTLAWSAMNDTLYRAVAGGGWSWVHDDGTFGTVKVTGAQLELYLAKAAPATSKAQRLVVLSAGPLGPEEPNEVFPSKELVYLPVGSAVNAQNIAWIRGVSGAWKHAKAGAMVHTPAQAIATMPTEVTLIERGIHDEDAPPVFKPSMQQYPKPVPKSTVKPMVTPMAALLPLTVTSLEEWEVIPGTVVGSSVSGSIYYSDYNGFWHKLTADGTLHPLESDTDAIWSKLTRKGDDAAASDPYVIIEGDPEGTGPKSDAQRTALYEKAQVVLTAQVGTVDAAKPKPPEPKPVSSLAAMYTGMYDAMATHTIVAVPRALSGGEVVLTLWVKGAGAQGQAWTQVKGSGALGGHVPSSALAAARATAPEDLLDGYVQRWGGIPTPAKYVLSRSVIAKSLGLSAAGVVTTTVMANNTPPKGASLTHPHGLQLLMLPAGSVVSASLKPNFGATLSYSPPITLWLKTSLGWSQVVSANAVADPWDLPFSSASLGTFLTSASVERFGPQGASTAHIWSAFSTEPAPAPAAPGVTYLPCPSAEAPPATALPFDLGASPIWADVGGVDALAKRLDGQPKGAAQGGTPGGGGLMVDPLTGNKFYVKWPGKKQAESEVLALRLYRMLGIHAPDARMCKITSGATDASIKNPRRRRNTRRRNPSGWVTISPWQDGYFSRYVVSGKPKNGGWLSDELTELATWHYLADSWLANHDAIGAGVATPYDNTLVTAAYDAANPKHFLKVEAGGALGYKGTGGAKEAGLWTDDADVQLTGMLDGTNKTAKYSYKKVLKDPGLTFPMVNRMAKLTKSDLAKAAKWVGFAQADALKMASRLLKRADSIEEWAANKGWTEGALGLADAPAPAPAPTPMPVPTVPPAHVPVGDPKPPPPYLLDTFTPHACWANGGGVDSVVSRLVYTGKKTGGTGDGFRAKDPLTGQVFYVKSVYRGNAVNTPGMLKSRAATEQISATLYRSLGIFAPDMRWAKSIKPGLWSMAGMSPSSLALTAPVVLSPWEDGYGPFNDATSIEKGVLALGFLADVWLDNWDVYGASGDNLLRGVHAKMYRRFLRVDPGGTLYFRAMGAEKGTSGTPPFTKDAAAFTSLMTSAQGKVLWGNLVGGVLKQKTRLRDMYARIRVLNASHQVGHITTWADAQSLPLFDDIGSTMMGRASDIGDRLAAKGIAPFFTSAKVPTVPWLWGRLQMLAAAGQKISAIKTFKAATGQGLKESKEWVETAIAQGTLASGAPTGHAPLPATDTPAPSLPYDPKVTSEADLLGLPVGAVVAYKGHGGDYTAAFEKLASGLWQAVDVPKKNPNDPPIASSNLWSALGAYEAGDKGLYIIHVPAATPATPATPATTATPATPAAVLPKAAAKKNFPALRGDIILSSSVVSSNMQAYLESIPKGTMVMLRTTAGDVPIKNALWIRTETAKGASMRRVNIAGKIVGPNYYGAGTVGGYWQVLFIGNGKTTLPPTKDRERAYKLTYHTKAQGPSGVLKQVTAAVNAASKSYKKGGFSMKQGASIPVNAVWAPWDAEVKAAKDPTAQVTHSMPVGNWLSAEGKVLDMALAPIGAKVKTQSDTHGTHAWEKVGDDKWIVVGSSGDYPATAADFDISGGKSWFAVAPAAPAAPAWKSAMGVLLSAQKAPVGTEVIYHSYTPMSEHPPNVWKKTAENTWTNADTGEHATDNGFASAQWLVTGHWALATPATPAAPAWKAPSWKVPSFAKAWLDPDTLDTMHGTLPVIALYTTEGSFGSVWVANAAGETKDDVWYKVTADGTVSTAKGVDAMVETIVVFGDIHVLFLGDLKAQNSVLAKAYKTAKAWTPPEMAPAAPEVVLTAGQKAAEGAPKGPAKQAPLKVTTTHTPIMVGWVLGCMKSAQNADTGNGDTWTPAVDTNGVWQSSETPALKDLEQLPVGTVVGEVQLTGQAVPAGAYVRQAGGWKAILPQGDLDLVSVPSKTLWVQGNPPQIRLVGKGKVPPADLLKKARTGLVIQAPRAVGTPSVQVAPSYAVYQSMPVGTILRSDVTSMSVTVYAMRYSGGYGKLAASGDDIDSSKRDPATLATEFATKAKGHMDLWLVYLGNGTALPATTRGEWISGKSAAQAQAQAKLQHEHAIQAAAELGVDPRVAALFSSDILQLVKTRKGLPFFGSWTPNPRRRNLQRHIPAVRHVLQIQNPSNADLERAAVLEAAGLPLSEVFGTDTMKRRNPWRGPHRRNTPPMDLTEQKALLVDMANAVVEALGAKLESGGTAAQKALRQKMDKLLGDMYGGGGAPRPEHTQGAQFFRYLVLARALNLWPNRIDPGQRAVMRGFHVNKTAVNSPGQSFRFSVEAKEQRALLVADGLVSSGAKYTTCIEAWFKAQTGGIGGYVRDNSVWRKALPSELIPPSSYAEKMSLGDYNGGPSTIRGRNAYDTVANKRPYPSWASQPWANVEGMATDYHNQTYQHFTFTEWGAFPWSYETQKSFGLRSNTRDPRFVLLPGTKIQQGHMKSFPSEGAVLFVSIDDTPLKADWVTMGNGGIPGNQTTSSALRSDQINAWWQARVPYPSDSPPVGESAKTLITRNPAAAPQAQGPRDDVCTLVFNDKGAAKVWAREHGYSGSWEKMPGGVRLRVNRASAFRRGSFRKVQLGPGVTALVGKPR
jgi:hypothetical protein